MKFTYTQGKPARMEEILTTARELVELKNIENDPTYAAARGSDDWEIDLDSQNFGTFVHFRQLLDLHAHEIDIEQMEKSPAYKLATLIEELYFPSTSTLEDETYLKDPRTEYEMLLLQHLRGTIPSLICKKHFDITVRDITAEQEESIDDLKTIYKSRVRSLPLGIQENLPTAEQIINDPANQEYSDTMVMSDAIMDLIIPVEEGAARMAHSILRFEQLYENGFYCSNLPSRSR